MDGLPPDINVMRVLAPRGWDSKSILLHLKMDPYQSRVSKFVIPLTHPRTGKMRPLKEFVEDLVGDMRFAIETTDGLVFISWVRNSSMGDVYIASTVLPFDAIEVVTKDL